MNPLNPPIYDLFYRLNILNGLLFTLNNQLNNFERLFRDSFSKSSIDISKISSGASLVIRDLTEWPEDGWARYYSSGKFRSKGEEYFKYIGVLTARESAWTVSQAYEAFEKFLKDISATLLIENQELAANEKVDKFESDRKSHNLKKTDISFWRTYFEYHYGKNKEKLKFLRKICPEISESEINNNRVINLTEWFTVVEEVRHSATHSDFIIKSNRMGNWSKSKQEILKKYFPGNDIDQGYQLDIKREDATMCLQLFSEYSFQIYKCLSISKGYNWQILK